MTSASKLTVLKLLADIGAACADYQDRIIRNVRARRIQVDEIWQFVYSKAKNVPENRRGCSATVTCGRGWRLMPTPSSSRHGASALEMLVRRFELMMDLAGRLFGRVQLTTDGFKVYLGAVEDAFGADIDYAMLRKVYGVDPQAERSYSPAKILSTTMEVIRGEPNPKHISTSYVERQNLTMRMSMRRFTRLTNGFSKKLENHAAAVSLHYMHYNFARIHKALRVTPAMAAGISDHVWSLDEIVGLLETEAWRRAA